MAVAALPAKATYYIGNDPKEWRRDVPLYARVKSPNVCPGIDLVYHGGDEQQLEYHFVVAPIYDSVANLVMTASIAEGGTLAGKPCWTATKTGFKYKNNDLIPDGISELQLTAGVAEKAKVKVIGKGEHLLMPALLLTQASTVTVQLKNANGICWEVGCSAPAKKNDATGFNDKSD